MCFAGVFLVLFCLVWLVRVFFRVLVYFLVFIKAFTSSRQGYGKPHSNLDEGDRIVTQRFPPSPAIPPGKGNAYRVLRAGRASPASPEGLQRAESRALAMPRGQRIRQGAPRPSPRTHPPVFPPFPNYQENSRLHILNTTFIFFDKTHHFSDKAEARLQGKLALKLLVLPV